MAVPAKHITLTHQEYLELENSGSIRHEYVCGCVFAMVGATDAHNRIALNIASFLHQCLRGTGCAAYVSDMKLFVEASDSFYYPDVMVTCEQFDPKSVVKTKPVLIAEITSPSTAVIDRREKLAAYGLIPSLREYMIVHQDKQLVELYGKDEAGRWVVSSLAEGEVLISKALSDTTLSLPLTEIYNAVFDG